MAAQPQSYPKPTAVELSLIAFTLQHDYSREVGQGGLEPTSFAVMNVAEYLAEFARLATGLTPEQIAGAMGNYKNIWLALIAAGIDLEPYYRAGTHYGLVLAFTAEWLRQNSRLMAVAKKVSG